MISACSTLKEKKALPFIERFLNSNTVLTNYHLFESCGYYLDLGGKLSVVENLLASELNFDRFERIKLVELLIDNHSKKVVPYMDAYVSSENDGDLIISISKKLMKSGDVNGLRYYYIWMKKYNHFDHFIGGSDFTNLPVDRAFPILIDMLELYMSANFDRLTPLHRIRIYWKPFVGWLPSRRSIIILLNGNLQDTPSWKMEGAFIIT